jgi:hypothetical protein
VVGDPADETDVWFESYPRPQGAAGRHMGATAQVVDADVVALFGVYDYWRLTHDPIAGKLFDGGATTIDNRLQDIRQPDQLAHNDLNLNTGTAALQRVLVRQLALLTQMTGSLRFGLYARLLTKDVQ